MPVKSPPPTASAVAGAGARAATRTRTALRRTRCPSAVGAPGAASEEPMGYPLIGHMAKSPEAAMVQTMNTVTRKEPAKTRPVLRK
jgi:hypothetical protein